ncbi:hypothetical protein RU97_GL000541 [Enterococcus canis]|uniref:BD-FAE-like domain-containing protein n=1 Tax=Enterococcus canis TaxID=214095 RepID=A0A1L8RKP3_9ENTE|nr:alpha/beta hydrolase [Enterococcus canis]OJG20308.1 hypothetical protein RU97_GL000541 [Enterococcus canis]
MIRKTIPVVSGNHEAQLESYIIENYAEMDLERKRPAIVICPGGGYGMVSAREAEPIANAMIGKGLHAFVLTYSVAPTVFPTSLRQLAKSIQLIRQHAAEWHIDPDKIIVAGFSAGGHLAASLGVMWQDEVLSDLNFPTCRPNGLLLSYPVISSEPWGHQDSFKNLLGRNYEKDSHAQSLEKLVSPDTPPTFLWHTAEDGLVVMQNSLTFAEALQQNGVSVELHIFAKGGHGLGLGTTETMTKEGYGIEPNVQSWINLFETWLHVMGFL